MKILSSVILLVFAINLTAQVAQTPPMGWNSYDCYGAAVTEAEVKANADVMASLLKHVGWEYIVVDYCWSYPHIGALDNPPQTNDFIPWLNMDDYGRLLPAIDRFPSAANGQGFKPLADYVHGKGLKFGIHIMRGIPRQAAANAYKIEGSEATAADIAETNDSCTWLDNMWGVDMSKKGAQEYYNSLFKLYASWGVDYVKIDDILSPFHEEEIIACYKAMKNCGREMVISTSHGSRTPIEKAGVLKQYTNMWRISSDFWDRWEDLKHQFELCHNWEQHIGPGHWPDADMIPIGRLNRRGPIPPERDSRFTANEKQTLMTLWAIARSPLMIGGDLTMLYRHDMYLFTNKNIIQVNQHSENNHQLFRRGNHVAWVADVPNSNNKYLAVFNLGEDVETPVYVLLSDLGIDGKCQITDLWNNEVLGTFNKEFMPLIGEHGAGMYLVGK